MTAGCGGHRAFAAVIDFGGKHGHVKDRPFRALLKVVSLQELHRPGHLTDANGTRTLCRLFSLSHCCYIHVCGHCTTLFNFDPTKPTLTSLLVTVWNIQSNGRWKKINSTRLHVQLLCTFCADLAYMDPENSCRRRVIFIHPLTLRYSEYEYRSQDLEQWCGDRFLVYSYNIRVGSYTSRSAYVRIIMNELDRTQVSVHMAIYRNRSLPSGNINI